jgi:hypothetical protein
MEYASKGVGSAGLTTGIIGTALGAMNGGILPNLFGGGCNNNCSENMAVNRYEMTMSQQLAQKDMEISYWRGQDETNRKISDAYAKLEGRINAVDAKVDRNRDEQCAVNMQQAVYNGTNTAAIGCIQGQIAQLMGLTKLVVPNTSVCPGWGDVTVSVTPATTTTPAG